MKISKRILGVALALIMIFNVFAVGTFAAFPEDTAVKLIVKTDKASYAAGETVTLTIAEKVIAEVGQMTCGGSYELGYNSAVIAPLSVGGSLADNGFVINSALAAGYDAELSGTLASMDGVDGNAYGWDSAITYVVAEADKVPFDCVDAEYDVFTVQMKIADNAADGTYTIGFNPLAYENYNGYSNDLANGGLYGTSASDYGYSVANMFEYGTVEITVGAAAPSVVVTHKGTQSKWNNATGTPVAADYLFGFLGNVSGLELTTVKDQTTGKAIVQEIKSITATATIGGRTETADVQTVWVDANGGYTFRAQFANATPDKTDSVSVTFAITMSDGTTVYETADAATATIKGIYDLSVTKGLPELTA